MSNKNGNNKFNNDLAKIKQQISLKAALAKSPRLATLKQIYIPELWMTVFVKPGEDEQKIKEKYLKRMVSYKIQAT